MTQPFPHVAVTDVNAARLAQALDLGLDQAVPAGSDLAEVGADVLLECTGVEAVAGAGIAALMIAIRNPALVATIAAAFMDRPKDKPTGRRR